MEAFKEEQRFIKYWWVIFLPGFLLLIGISLFTVAKDDGEAFMVAMPASLVVFGWLAMLKLTSRIDEKGITFAYFPIVGQRTIRWEEVKRATIRKTEPLTHYGGWGVRRFGKKRAYNVWGQKGLVVEMKNGREFMLGTNAAERMSSYLAYIKEKYGINAL